MSDFTEAGFTDVGDGFQVQFIENANADANLEMIVDGERKFSTTHKIAVKSAVSATETLSIDSPSGQTAVVVGNSKKVCLIVAHTESAGTCKIIPVGIIDGGGIAPLEELSFTASSCYITDTGTLYYSYVQEFDTKGFAEIMFLVSELSASNVISAWAGPGDAHFVL